MMKGQQIALHAEIKQLSENVWLVPSQTGNGNYEVTKLGESMFACTCPDFENRVDKYGDCKHIYALQYFSELQNKVYEDTELSIEESRPQVITICPDCQSNNVINYGKRGKRVVKQLMFCKDCNRQFRKGDDVFAKLQNEPRVISLILSMHCRNVSLRGICATLDETYGIKVSYQTIFNYLKRYEKLLGEYMSNLKPKFSGHVNVDELYIKIDGQMKYLFGALDPDTRYLLCTVLSQKKDDKGARRLFHELARVTKHHKYNETIKTITTDGLPSYKVAFEKEFVTHQRTNTKNPPKHLFNAGIAKEINNNMMERLNGTIRSREKNYRGLKIDDTPMIPLFVAYYNMIREHQAIEKTPAEAAGLEKLGKDKWINLIKKAHKNPDGRIRVWQDANKYS